MPSSYSPNLKIELIAVGEQTDAWGGTTNDNFENVFEEAITGMASAIFPADADYDWATGYVNSVGSQAQRNLVIEVQGTLSATRSLIVPTIEKQYLIHNNTLGGQAILVKTVAGTGITVPNGQRAHLFVNGTNVIAVVDYFPTIRAGSATLDTALPVTSGGTGSTSLTTITVGTATNIAGGAANRIPYNTGAGVTSFVVAPTSPNTLLEWDGSAFVWSALPSTVGSFSAGTTGLTPNTPTTGAVVLGGTLAIANGGSGQTTAQAAMNAFAGAVTSGSYLRGNGTNVVMSAIQAGDVPTLNQNTTGTASNVTGVVAIANGGTGQATANAALNALLPTQTGNTGEYLTTDGSNTSWAAVPVGTTFSAGTTGFTPNSATSGAVTLAGTLNIANGGTGQTTANAALNALLPSQASNNGKYLTTDGSNTSWATVTGGVTTFSGGTTGLTPAVATSGAVTLGGTLAVANGGTGVTTSTGTGSVVLSTGPTLSGPTINDGYTEEVYAIPSSTTPALSPANGSIQTWALTGNSTPTAGTWNAGQSILLMIDDGTAFSVTWTSVPVTWLTNGGVAPLLATSGYTAIVLWKVGSIVYGARVGDNV